MDKEAWRARFEDQLSRVPPERAAAVRRRLESMDLPDRAPAHGPGMIVADDGHLWVREYVHRGSGELPGWQVFDPEGRWLGRVAPPKRVDVARVTLHQVGPWGALVVWQDDFGVQRVAVWELIATGSPTGGA